MKPEMMHEPANDTPKYLAASTRSFNRRNPTMAKPPSKAPTMKNGHMSNDSASFGAEANTCGLELAAAFSCINEHAAHNTIAKRMVWWKRYVIVPSFVTDTGDVEIVAYMAYSAKYLFPYG